jgi:ABC-type branched-subunit amino acid transport system substrate-binding protein/outer membrane protein assembly factor BamD (BamD/ComL family)
MLNIFKQSRAGLSISLVVILLLFAGVSFAVESGKDAKGDIYTQAEQRFRAGNFSEAQTLYQEFVTKFPGDKRMDQVFYRLGQIDLKTQSYKTALRYFYFVLTKYPNSFLVQQARFDMAECHFKLGNFSEAEELFQGLSKNSTDTAKRWEAVLYLGLIDDGRSEYENAIAKLKSVHAESTNDELKNRASKVIELIINEKLPKSLVLSLSQKYRVEYPAEILMLKAMMIFRLESDVENYKSYHEEFLRRFPKHPMRAELEKKISQVKKNDSNILRIGAVLPLTGKYALTGQQVLQGIQLAWNQLPGAEREGLELVVKNSGELQMLNSVVEELASDPGMVSIIGPLFSNNVKNVIPVIEKYQMPIFTPTASTPGLTQLSSYVFRNAMTKENQGRYLAEYAFNKLNLRRMVVLYPDESYGVEMKDIFSREFKSLGGQVVSAVSYDRAQNDFKEQIHAIGGISDHKLKKYADKEYIPSDEKSPLSKPVIERGVTADGQDETLNISLELAYDGIFLPGQHDKVGLILPQLAYYNIDKVPVLGGSGWNSPALGKIGGKYLRRAFFVDGYFPNAPEKEVRAFVGSFKATFGDEPTIYSAQSYDATKIILELIRKGAKNRVQVKSQLYTIKDFPGVSGKTSILSSGESEKSLFPLKFKGERIVPASEED